MIPWGGTTALEYIGRGPIALQYIGAGGQLLWSKRARGPLTYFQEPIHFMAALTLYVHVVNHIASLGDAIATQVSQEDAKKCVFITQLPTKMQHIIVVSFPDY